MLNLYIVEEYLRALLARLVDWTPAILGAFIVLAVGWVLGRVIGSGVSKVLDKVGIDDAVRKTAIGKALERSGMKIVTFFNLMVRWFVYLVAILAAVNILNITILSTFLSTVVQYLPSFIAGVFIIIFGMIVADFVGDAVKAVGREAKAEFSSVIGDALKFFLYFIVIVIGLSVMRIDVQILYIFANAFAWGAALGIGAAIAIAFGLGFKDYVARHAEQWVAAVISRAKEKRGTD